MTQAIRRCVTVQPGGVIEIRSPDLVPGTKADVLITPQPQEVVRGLSRLIGSVKDNFKSAAEADNFIRAERDAWEK